MVGPVSEEEIVVQGQSGVEGGVRWSVVATILSQFFSQFERAEVIVLDVHFQNAPLHQDINYDRAYEEFWHQVTGVVDCRVKNGALSLRGKAREEDNSR